MTTTQEIINNYFDCWNLTDPDERAAVVTKTWTEDATSSDPLNEVTGHDALDKMFAETQQTYPGHQFRQVGELDEHHNLVRWGWEVLDAEGTSVLEGIDVALRAEDGRLTYLAGFFGANIPAPA